MIDLLVTGLEDAPVALLLAHGAGAPMDSDWMNAVCGKLAGKGIRVVRFEFGYMAARRMGRKKPPPRAETLLDEYRAAIEAVGPTKALFIGGKSMGGRVASMIADDQFRAGRVAGLVCLGYPFHPPGNPYKLRVAHLEKLECPTLVCQGMRDPFGVETEVSDYILSPGIELFWLDGDHDLKPKKPATLDGNQDAVAEKIAMWTARMAQ